MRHRARVERNYETGTDPLENPLPPRFETLHAALPCRYWTQAGRTAISEEVTAVVEDERMIVPVDADIHEADRVTAIWDRRWSVLNDDTHLIQSVLWRNDHKELVLETVQ
jgi:hypothetical protein